MTMPLGPLGDPVTLGEVDRNVQRLREEVREGLANVTQRMDRALDGTVPANVYASDKNAWEYRLSDAEKAVVACKKELEGEIAELKTEIAKKEEISRGQKNVVLVAFIFPTLVLFVNTGITFYFRVTGK